MPTSVETHRGRCLIEQQSVLMLPADILEKSSMSNTKSAGVPPLLTQPFWNLGELTERQVMAQRFAS